MFKNCLFVHHSIDPQGGRRKTARWFTPLEKGQFDQEIPSEWEGDTSG